MESLVQAPFRRAGRLLFSDRPACSIRMKMLAFTCGMVAALTAGNIALSSCIAHRQAERQSTESLLALAVGFAGMVESDAIPSEGLGAALAVRIVNLSRAVDDAYVLDREGRIVAEAHESEVPRVGRALRDPPVLRTIIERRPTVSVDGGDATAVAPVVDFRGDVSGYVVLRGGIESDSHVLGAVAIAASVSLALGMLWAAWFSRWLTRPIEALSIFAERISRGEIGRSVSIGTRDEFRRLADALNRMMVAAAASKAAYESAKRNLVAAARQAEAANVAKSEFLAGIGHELRTPLNAIIGLSDLLIGVRSSALPEVKRRGYARDINKAGRHLLTAVSRILDYAQMDGGSIELSKAPTDIAALVLSLVQRLDALAVEAGVILSASVAPDLPLARCDCERLSQAFENLICNAVQFTRRGGYVTVSLRLSDANEIELRIADNGVGIANADLGTALMPLGRPGRNASSGPRGIGLGLPFARKLIELHEGAFRIESYANVGTVVTVHLPADRVVEARTPIVA
jgi:signal transduction histidine kinase